MNVKDPVSSIMNSKLITISEDADLEKIKELFNSYNISHLPVVDYKKLKGLISLSEVSFLINPSRFELESIEAAILETGWIKAKNLMRTRLAKLEPDDKIEVAIDIFLNNHFHCLPIVKGEELVGIVTPNDILRGLV
ncbi:MAG: CBS domain-containing protein [Saprospiraceae bacterium]|nr:CBS domain-containing protein [Saprospiraceae bacterium]